MRGGPASCWAPLSARPLHGQSISFKARASGQRPADIPQTLSVHFLLMGSRKMFLYIFSFRCAHGRVVYLRLRGGGALSKLNRGRIGRVRLGSGRGCKETFPALRSPNIISPRRLPHWGDRRTHRRVLVPSPSQSPSGGGSPPLCRVMLPSGGNYLGDLCHGVEIGEGAVSVFDCTVTIFVRLGKTSTSLATGGDEGRYR